MVQSVASDLNNWLPLKLEKLINNQKIYFFPGQFFMSFPHNRAVYVSMMGLFMNSPGYALLYV
jgi:hypothetical protein